MTASITIAPASVKTPVTAPGKTPGKAPGPQAGKPAAKASVLKSLLRRFGGADQGGQADRPPTRGAFRTGMAIVVIFFGIGGGWAATADLSSAAVAHGRVTVDSNRKTVQHLEGGIIRTLHVKDGDHVKAGAPLITLDDAQARATYELLNAQFMSLRAQEARLIAERDALPAVQFPKELLEAAGNPEAVQVMEGQKSLLEKRRQSQETRHAILGQRIAQLHSEIDSLAGQMAATDRQLASIGDEERTVRGLVAKGLERKPRLQALERNAAQLKGQRDALTAGIAKAEQEISEARYEDVGLDNELQTEVAAELRETQTRLADLRERLSAAGDVLKRQVIAAPIAGTVVEMQYFTTGGVIAGGRPILDIVPQDDTLIVEAKVRPTDIDNVAQGLPAEVNFTAFKARTTPTLKGNVSYISPDSLADERTGQHYYTARVSIPSDQLALLDGQALTPGMPADVMIVTGERTALQYLMQPLTDSFRNAFREF